MADRVALVTGCSSGIGRATVRAFQDADWRVYATSRDEADVADLDEAGCGTAELDVTDDAAVDRVVGRVLDEAGRIDCLVNNAGYAQHGPLEDVPVDRLHRQFEVNVYGPHRLTRSVLPGMRERGDGTVVNVSSVAGWLATPGTGAYSASKHALEAMSDALRVEVDQFGVDVVVVQPGPVATAFGDRVEAELDRLNHTDAYSSLYRFHRDGLVFSSDSPVAIQPETVAETILEAACSPDPDPRYRVGPLARLLAPARFVPDRVSDRVFRLLRRFAS